MTSWASLADRIFKRERCEKLIKYQDRSFEFKGIGIEIPGFKLSFEGFSSEPRILQNATEAAKALDDLQYQLCQDLSKKSVTEILDRDVLARYTKARMSSFFLFSSFRAALVAFKEDQEGQRINLEKSIEDIQRFTSSLTSEDLIAPQELPPKSRDAISSALKSANINEQELDSVLLDKFAEFEKTQTEILERVKQIQESFETQVTELRLSGASVELVTASKQYNKGDPNCWKDAYFSDADIKNGYDARRPITYDIIKSIEACEGTFVYGDPYVGKSILVKRVMFEMADKGYAVIYSSGAAAESNAYQIKGLLTSLSKTYSKVFFIADDAHRAANESFFRIFNEFYDINAEKSISFLFAAREKQLDKEKPVIARALRKIPKEAQYRIGFSLDDAILFLQQAVEVTYGTKAATTDIVAITIQIAKSFYEISRRDPFMFSLGIKYVLEGGDQELENLVSKEMRALIRKIEEIERDERIQNNELWKATIMSAIMGIATIMLERKSHPNLFKCSKILPVRFWTLLQGNNILLKESDEGKLRIRHEMFAYEFLYVLYENNFNNDLELFNEYYGYILKCIWDSIGVDEIIDMLDSCSYLYDIERYRLISELITSPYLVPLDQFSPPPGIHDSDKAKLFCDGLGNFYVSRKEYKKSLDCYDKALKIKPDYIDAWNNKGNVLGDLDEPEEAIKCYDKAIELDPNYAGVWYNKGLALGDLDEPEEAIKHFDKAIELDPDYIDAWNNKGSTLYNLGNHKGAIKHFDKAIEINPDYAGAWYNKGNVLGDLDEPEEAIKCYDKAIELDPDYIGAWNNKGNVLDDLGRHKEAIVCFDKVIELDPNYAGAWYNKGNVLGDLDEPEEAIKCYDKAIELDPDYATARYSRAWYKVKKGDIENGLADLKKAIEIDKELIELAKQDKGFETIKNDERFKALVMK